MRTVKITWPSPVSDGDGGMHPTGAVVALPDDIAKLFVDRGMAVWAEDINSAQARLIEKEAEEAAKERIAQEAIAQAKAHADRAMAIHDAMPAEIRAAANEHGGDVAIAYLNEQIRAEEAKRARQKGVPRETLPTAADDSIDDGFDRVIAEAEDDGVPKKRRGRKRNQGND